MCIFKNWNEVNSENEKKSLNKHHLEFSGAKGCCCCFCVAGEISRVFIAFYIHSLAAVSGFVMPDLGSFIAPCQPDRKERSTLTGTAVKVAACT